MDAVALGLKVLNTKTYENCGAEYTVRCCVNKYDESHIAFSVTNESTRVSKLYNFIKGQVQENSIPEDIENDIFNRKI